MAKRRTRHKESFNARLPSGRSVRVDVWVTEVDASTLDDTTDRWVEVAMRLESDLGPVNSVDGQLVLARDGTPITRT
jgi:hypothetical protein